MLDLVGTALAEVAPTQGWVGVLLTALLALALLLIPDGATPRVIAVGSWTPSAFNAGRFRFTFTSTQASSAPAYAGSYIALLGNGLGGLWIVDRVLTLFNQSGSVFARPITFNASQPVTVTIDVTGPTGTVTIEGAAGGNGTYTFTNTGVYFATGETLGIGVYNAGGYNFPGTIGAIDDAALPITATSSAILGAVSGGATLVGTVVGATSTATLGPVDGATAASILDPVTATSVATLGAVSGATSVEIINGTAAHSSATLGEIVGSASATVAVEVSSSAQLGGALGQAAAAVAVVASSAMQLGELIGVSSGVPPLPPLAMGARAIVQRMNASGAASGTLSTTGVTTGSQSAFVASVARGRWSVAPAPAGATDNKGNTYVAAAGSPHTYPAPWTASQAGVYVSLWNEGTDVWPVGGADHQWQGTWGDYGGGTGDEVTVAGWEIVGARYLQDASWVERTSAATLTSGTVTTTGPAVLLAIVFGTGPVGQTHVVTFHGGVTKLTDASAEGNPSNNGYIQESSGFLVVDGPGTYSVSLSYAIPEGAQIFLLAFQQDESIVATSSATLGAIGGTAAASVIAGASSTHTLGAVTGAAAGTVAITATTASQLGHVGGTAAATVAVAGSSSSSLGAVTGTAAAAVLVAATSAAVLDPITGAASASTAADPAVTASSSATLGAITGTAAATAAIAASSIAALGPVTGSAVASTQPIVTASSSAVLGAIGGAAAATVSAAVVRDLRPGVVVSLVDHRKAARLIDRRLACHLEEP